MYGSELIKHMENVSMLPCVCSVIDHRRSQYVVRTKERRYARPGVSLMSY